MLIVKRPFSRNRWWVRSTFRTSTKLQCTFRYLGQLECLWWSDWYENLSKCSTYSSRPDYGGGLTVHRDWRQANANAGFRKANLQLHGMTSRTLNRLDLQ